MPATARMPQQQEIHEKWKGRQKLQDAFPIMKMCGRLAASFYLFFSVFFKFGDSPRPRLLVNIWNKAEDQRGSGDKFDLLSAAKLHLRLEYGDSYTGKRHGSTRKMTRPAIVPACYCFFGDDDRLYVFSKISAASAAGISRCSQLSSPWQGRRYGPSGQAVRTVHHSTNHTCLSTLLQLSWAGCRVGPAHTSWTSSYIWEAAYINIYKQARNLPPFNDYSTYRNYSIFTFSMLYSC